MVLYTRYIVDNAKNSAMKNIKGQGICKILFVVVQKIMHDNNVDIHFIIDDIIRDQTPKRRQSIIWNAQFPQKPNRSYLGLLRYVER